ncbi:MAG: hypothetical protein Q9202_005398 [Teloschistes flavicans]
MSNEEHTTSYQKVFPPSAPEKDFDDRRLLYSMTFNLIHAVHHADKVHAGEINVLHDIYKLCRKFCLRKLRRFMNELRLGRALNLNEPAPRSEEDIAHEGSDKEEMVEDDSIDHNRTSVDTT